MSLNSNLTKIDDGSTTNTTQFFNNYYSPTFTVSQNIDDAIIGFFEQIADNRESAMLLASAVIYTSSQQNVDPMSIIQQMSTIKKSELSSYLVVFLNQSRVGTSYLGINNRPKVGKYIKRTILP